MILNKTQIWKFLVDNNHCYATHSIDVGRNSTPFRIRLNSDSKMQTQRPAKILLPGQIENFIGWFTEKMEGQTNWLNA